MSNGTPSNLYQILDEKDVVKFNAQASALILEGFEPLGSVTTHQVGQNVTFLQAFWRPEAVNRFKGLASVPTPLPAA